MNREKLEKIKAFALDSRAPERTNASRILAKHGIFIDIATVEWSKKQLNKFSEEKRKYFFGFDPLKLIHK